MSDSPIVERKPSRQWFQHLESVGDFLSMWNDLLFTTQEYAPSTSRMVKIEAVFLEPQIGFPHKITL
jgi:hypothetical protein